MAEGLRALRGLNSSALASATVRETYERVNKASGSLGLGDACDLSALDTINKIRVL